MVQWSAEQAGRFGAAKRRVRQDVVFGDAHRRSFRGDGFDDCAAPSPPPAEELLRVRESPAVAVIGLLLWGFSVLLLVWLSGMELPAGPAILLSEAGLCLLIGLLLGAVSLLWYFVRCIIATPAGGARGRDDRGGTAAALGPDHPAETRKTAVCCCSTSRAASARSGAAAAPNWPLSGSRRSGFAPASAPPSCRRWNKSSAADRPRRGRREEMTVSPPCLADQRERPPRRQGGGPLSSLSFWGCPADAGAKPGPPPQGRPALRSGKTKRGRINLGPDSSHVPALRAGRPVRSALFLGIGALCPRSCPMRLTPPFSLCRAPNRSRAKALFPAPLPCPSLSFLRLSGCPAACGCAPSASASFRV